MRTALCGAANKAKARHEAIAVARVTYDLRMRYQAPTEIDPVRLDLWFAQVLVDLDAGDYGSVRGDAATALLVWDRIAHTYGDSTATEIAGLLDELAAAATAEDAQRIGDSVIELRAALSPFGWPAG